VRKNSKFLNLETGGTYTRCYSVAK